jgi:glycosyltransferase involved in cell wall biosynthesis
MTLETIDKQQIDAAVNRAMSLSNDEIAALSYKDALYLWRNLVFVAERIDLNEESAKMRVKMANRADELFHIVAEFEVNNPPKPEKPLNVFAPLRENALWDNSLVARDKGSTPYFLSKLTGGKCVFFFCDENDTFPVAERLPGAEFIKTDDASPESYETFIKEHIDEMDMLVTDDISTNIFNIMPLYKHLKPEGKILHVTDVNTPNYKTKCETDIFGRLGDLLLFPDAYTAASHIARDIMNADPRFPKPVYFNSNAYLSDKTIDSEIITADKKENIIVTAGRIGTRQKNNIPLIRAFLHIADDFPDWKLVLAGPCAEADKKALMNQALRGMPYRPDISTRIIFTGGLSKTDLYKNYAKTKIFALTSIFEGGTPNVFSEALAYGCYMVVADRLDGAPEMTTAFGLNIGTAYEAMKYTKSNPDFSVTIDVKGEAISLANTLVAVIPNLTESFFETHIKKCSEYLNRDFDYKKNSLKLFHLLYD